MSRKRLTTEQFIEDIFCSEVHPDGKYNYRLVEYIGALKNIEIYCNDCKESFWQRPDIHKQGNGCPKCYGTPKLTTDKILQLLTIEEEPIWVNVEVVEEEKPPHPNDIKTDLYKNQLKEMFKVLKGK